MTRRLSRCLHGLPPRLCVVPSCEHWDRKSDTDPTHAARPSRLKRRRDRAREQYALKRARQQQIADAVVAAKETT